jgi:hypothetical protein
MELELALSKGIQIVPVLVEGATMPAASQLPPSLQALPKLNGAEVRSGRDFPKDMADLATSLGIPVTPRSPFAPGTLGFWILCVSAVAALVGGAIELHNLTTSSTTDPRVIATLTAGI